RLFLQVFVLTSAVVFSLTRYTFWAVKEESVGPILFTCLMVPIPYLSGSY
ncbi:hypothetical protein MKX03_002725, partial [Papaver bracteatum]